MARDPAGTPAFDAWARRAGHLIASNQRLLLFPIISVLGQALAFLPVVAATRRSVGIDSFGQDLAIEQTRVADIAGGSPGASASLAVGAYLVVGVAIQAWAGAGFIRSIGWGGVVWLPGLRPFGRLVVIYALATATAYAIGSVPAVALLLLPVTFIVFGYADYSAVLEDRGPGSAIRRSFEVASRAPIASLFVFLASFAAEVLVFGLFATPLHDDPHVFAPFLLAYTLTSALVAYVFDCALIAVLLEVRGARSPLSERAGAGPAGS